ncbi:hypothetical protein THAOC_00518, partial [Thalassiosira oceanica]
MNVVFAGSASAPLLRLARRRGDPLDYFDSRGVIGKLLDLPDLILPFRALSLPLLGLEISQRILAGWREASKCWEDRSPSGLGIPLLHGHWRPNEAPWTRDTEGFPEGNSSTGGKMEPPSARPTAATSATVPSPPSSRPAPNADGRARAEGHRPSPLPSGRRERASRLVDDALTPSPESKVDGRKPNEEEAEAAGESQAEEAAANVVDDATGDKEAVFPPDNDTVKAEVGSDEAEAVDHDAILLAAFYTSLLRMLQSKAQFPVPVSTYYAKHLLSSVPSPGPRLDLKRTRHKKIGPFLAEMERDGVVMLGPSKDGKDKCAFLVGVNRKSRELIQFKREHWNKEDGASAQQDSGKATKMVVVDLFIVPSRIVEGMKLDRDAVSAAGGKAEERRGSGYLTKAECRSLVEGY